MVHPAAFAISLGLGLGAALFLIYTYANRTSPYSSRTFEEERPNRNENNWRDPYNSMRNQFVKYEQTIVNSIVNSMFHVSILFVFSDICSICLESFTGRTLNLECRHRFHRECIERSLQHSPLCPMCRADVKMQR